MRKLLATLIAGLAMVLVPASAAFAWHAGLTGTGACQPDGSFLVTWKVDNTSNNLPLTITYSSNTSVVAVNTAIPSGQSQTFNQTVDGTAAGSVSLTLKGKWVDKYGHIEDYWYPSKATVYLRYACQQPSTITVHKTTSPAGDQTAFSVTISTENGQVIGDATQSIKDGGTVVYKVTHGTYNVTEAAVDGWTQTSNTCKDIAVGSSEVESFSENNESSAPTNIDCAIVNTKNATPVTPPAGGQGGGQVLAATTTAPQVQAPVGAVNGGEGAASKTFNLAALLGLAGSVGSIGYGVRRLSKSHL